MFSDYDFNMTVINIIDAKDPYGFYNAQICLPDFLARELSEFSGAFQIMQGRPLMVEDIKKLANEICPEGVRPFKLSGWDLTKKVTYSKAYRVKFFGSPKFPVFNLN